MAACAAADDVRLLDVQAVEHGARLSTRSAMPTGRSVGLGPPVDHDAVVAAEVAQLAGVDDLDVRQNGM